MIISLQKQGLAGIGRMNGGMHDEQYRRLLGAAVKDCEDRPHEEKARTITIKIELTPLTTQDGACVDVAMVCKFGSSVPTYVGKPVMAMPKHGGDLIFNDLSEDNPAQKTIDE